MPPRPRYPRRDGVADGSRWRVPAGAGAARRRGGRPRSRSASSPASARGAVIGLLTIARDTGSALDRYLRSVGEPDAAATFCPPGVPGSGPEAAACFTHDPVAELHALQRDPAVLAAGRVSPTPLSVRDAGGLGAAVRLGPLRRAPPVRAPTDSSPAGSPATTPPTRPRSASFWPARTTFAPVHSSRWPGSRGTSSPRAAGSSRRPRCHRGRSRSPASSACPPTSPRSTSPARPTSTPR